MKYIALDYTAHPDLYSASLLDDARPVVQSIRQLGPRDQLRRQLDALAQERGVNEIRGPAVPDVPPR